MKTLHASAVAAMLALGAATSVVHADDLKEMKQTARAVAKKTAKAVVTVRLSITITIGDREPQEQKVEATGTVIDESGLTVIPATALDPMSALGGFGRGGRRGGGGGGGGGQFQIDSEISSIAIVGEDGKELAAEIALKDQELDLAFLRPTTATKLDYVELKGDRTPEVLDDVFCVGRLGRGANHVVTVATGEVRAVVKGSKGFYVCDNEISTGHLGCVAYAADGTPLGIFATRAARPEAGAGGPGMGGMMGGRRDVQVVIRPVADILELAKQAKEKKSEKKDERKPDEKKPEPKKDEKKGEKKGDDF